MTAVLRRGIAASLTRCTTLGPPPHTLARLVPNSSPDQAGGSVAAQAPLPVFLGPLETTHLEQVSRAWPIALRTRPRSRPTNPRPILDKEGYMGVPGIQLKGFELAPTGIFAFRGPVAHVPLTLHAALVDARADKAPSNWFNVGSGHLGFQLAGGDTTPAMSMEMWALGNSRTQSRITTPPS
ncbi:hypothetical protein K438DRAFT_1762443 [Mycena galopus ATCC 62051]|nr:hypothetical protein K438DRAFT_1762443 [Mycena galopus ATCC 62051]